MNVELASKALESAKANPERFDMGTFFSGYYGTAEVTEEHAPPCGTTACYAGWVAFHCAPAGSKVEGVLVSTPGSPGPVHIEAYAIEALEITYDQAGVLFFLEDIGEVEAALRYLADNPDAGHTDLYAAVSAAAYVA